MIDGVRRVYGLLRSAGIYRANPVFRRRAHAFYAGFVRPGDLCFDIGAHMGDRVAVFLSLGARVVAVEPQPDFQRILRAQFGRNPRAVLEAGAVGAHAGTAELRINRRHPTLSTLSADWIAAVGRDASFPTTGWNERLMVTVTTLDALIAEHGVPAFCKIDVEGFEQQVLAGLSRPLPCLSFEYIAVTRDMAVACIDRLEQLGKYRFNVSPGESKRLLFDAWIGRDALVDWLAGLRPGDGSGDVYARLDW
ncbi:MAG TPA: FkbM family methyltransferase [Azospirillum sp.]|nr:FkbM family methyltransferase [Azospirillum sp.]